MHVLLFAGLAERLGARELELRAPLPARVSELREHLAEQQPELAGAVYRVSVNHAYAQEDDALTEGDEIALIPPVSGG
ncbi:MAG: molybdopterin synthase sulfur carrier subunit [Planctomycetota bacterium]|nr:MAG: molybdopterin synthase sulfur carrier subunit [Planctomycetota bacterium]